MANHRHVQTFKNGWKFSRTDDAAAVQVTFDDSHWQAVSVPHDWAIYGPFDATNDRQHVAIEQDGQKEALAHAGRTGGLPFVGVGWYRLQFTAPEFAEGRRATLLFDGAMSHARVWINGHEVGYWPYGYNAFYFDVTPYLNIGGENTLAVRLENFEESSRWYPGAGLYRNVHLIVTDELAVKMWGTYVTTPVVRDNFAKVNVQVEVDVPEDIDPTKVRIETDIYNPVGQHVYNGSMSLDYYEKDIVTARTVVTNPQLWSPDTPNLYKAVTSVLYDNDTTDVYETTFGIRTIEIVPDKGFYLNGERTLFKGTCNHHDNGPLGAVANATAVRRKIRLLKEMGSNAYRT
jgi:beta-galactosidase